MNPSFASRMSTVGRSFTREILKVTQAPDIISFAGGLPNPAFIPVKAIADAAAKVLNNDGLDALQYRPTEGYLPLRQYIAQRYRTRRGLEVEADEILITTGSQQGLDLVGKVFLDRDDTVIVEQPTYLAAIQAFGLYQPRFLSVPLMEDGIDVAALQATLAKSSPKLMYSVPNFQNPTGISYSEEKRRALADALRDRPILFIEDDPYGDLRFKGRPLPSMRSYLPDNTILLGSFSKTVAPGLRLGWICARRAVMDKLIIAKQAADLHTEYLAQRILHQYLTDNDVDAHIQQICQAYGHQRDVMLRLIPKYLPQSVRFTRPDGGMFLWLTLPHGQSSLDLFDRAIRTRVAFVPGRPFFANGGGDDTARINFSNSDDERIEEGLRRLGQAMDMPA
jgi:2-aminoadipate transaminase